MLKCFASLLVMISLVGPVVAEETPIAQMTKQEQPLQFKQDSVLDASFIVKMVVVLVFLLAILVSVAFTMKKMGLGINVPITGKEQHIKLAEVKRLSTKTTLFYLIIDNTPMVLAQNGDGLLLLNKSEWNQSQQSDNSSQNIV